MSRSSALSEASLVAEESLERLVLGAHGAVVVAEAGQVLANPVHLAPKGLVVPGVERVSQDLSVRLDLPDLAVRLDCKDRKVVTVTLARRDVEAPAVSPDAWVLLARGAVPDALVGVVLEAVPAGPGSGVPVVCGALVALRVVLGRMAAVAPGALEVLAVPGDLVALLAVTALGVHAV